MKTFIYSFFLALMLLFSASVFFHRVLAILLRHLMAVMRRDQGILP